MDYELFDCGINTDGLVSIWVRDRTIKDEERWIQKVLTKKETKDLQELLNESLEKLA